MHISFGLVLDDGCRQLTRARREIHLTPKAFELLKCFAEARPKVLSKVVLQQHLWPETFVAEANLSTSSGKSARPSVIRRALHIHQDGTVSATPFAAPPPI